jgi:outer membrane biosynthesis protein TonB
VFGLAASLGCAKPTAEASSPEEPIPRPPPPVGESLTEPVPPASSDSSAAAPDVSTFEGLMALAIDTPNPDNKALQQTKAARFDKTNGHSTVQFCVERDGITSDIQTVEKFPGDPLVDQILRDTVAKWRFKPLPVKVCTDRKFNIRFAPAAPPPAAE